MESVHNVPADVFSLKQLGVDYWQENYCWPVSDTEFGDLTDALFSAFDELYETQDSEGRDLLLCDTGFLFFLGQHLHALVSETTCEKNGVNVIVGPLSSPFYRPDWDSLSEPFMSFHSLERWRFQVRRVGKCLLFNKNASPLKRLYDLLRGQKIWSLGSFTRLKSEFVRSKGISCDHPYAQTLLEGSFGEAGEIIEEDLCSGLWQFIERMQGYMRKRHGMEFSAQTMVTCWTQRLTCLSALYRSFALRSAIPESLLITELSNPLHRLIALALKRKGTRIIGFHHGNDMGNAWEKFSAYSETALCDEYICPTKAAARFHSQENDKSGISQFHSPEFNSVETSYYLDLYLNSQKEPFPAYIKTVMIIGYPLNAVRYLYSTADFFIFQLDVELRVMELLKRKGFKVIYKMHPERRREATGIFDGLCDRILVEPFEKVWHQADAFFFGCTTSTTFGFALCTQRLVFVLDIQSRDWNREVYSDLSRRCIMIPASFDERNRVRFDESLLLAKMFQKPERPDFSYVQKFMFPEKGFRESEGQRQISHV